MKATLSILAAFLAGLKVTGAVDAPWWFLGLVYVASVALIAAGAFGLLAFVMSHVR